MTTINRRDVLGLLGAVPAALAFTWNQAETIAAADYAQQARAQATATGQRYTPKFFTAHEYATVVLLSDMIIPRDARSGSASDAGTPEFIDYIVSEQAARQTAMRGGLAWLDTECLHRFDRPFLGATDAERRRILDDIAYPTRARAVLRPGVVFFTTMRDLVASGFWSSRAGVADLGYVGNRPIAEWTGAPANVLQKLGVSYD